MEEKLINLGESFKSIFQPGWLMNFLIALIFIIPGIMYQLSMINMQNVVLQTNMATTLSNLVPTVILLIVQFFSMTVLAGYFMLYAHDRAINENAKLRDLTECIPDAFFAGAKGFIFYFVFCLACSLAMIPFVIIFIILAIIPVIRWIGIIFLLLFLWYWVVRLLFTLFAYYIRDLKLSSFFSLKKAFQFSKYARYGKFNLLIAFLLTYGLIFLIMIIIGVTIGALTVSKVMADHSAINNVYSIIGPFSIVMTSTFYILTWFFGIFWANIFGQFSHNAILAKATVEPELIDREINKDKMPVLIIFLAIVMFYTFMVVAQMTLSSAMVNTANKQQSAMADIKIKKAISNYENAVKLYMLENGKTSATEMYGYNCQNAESYFKIYQRYGDCKFTTTDGIYWELDQNTGEATVSDDYQNPNYTIKVGTCYDGSINCESQYPDAYNFMNE